MKTIIITMTFLVLCVIQGLNAFEPTPVLGEPKTETTPVFVPAERLVKAGDMCDILGTPVEIIYVHISSGNLVLISLPSLSTTTVNRHILDNCAPGVKV